jgi:tRNA A37 threonylcarbamoyladenosine synthetase subunit TsaC/SUA5/YrdC
VTNEAAVRRIYAIKGRPLDHPLIVHLPGAELRRTGWPQHSGPAR